MKVMLTLLGINKKKRSVFREKIRPSLLSSAERGLGGSLCQIRSQLTTGADAKRAVSLES